MIRAILFLAGCSLAFCAEEFPILEKEEDFRRGICDQTEVEEGVQLAHSLIIGSWTETSSLPEPLSDLSAVAYNGRLYIIGGRGEGDQSVSSVYCSKIAETGEIDGFVKLRPIPKDICGHTAFVWEGRIYVVGGSVYYKEGDVEREHPSDTIYFAKIDEDGAVEEWEESRLPSPIFSHQTALVDGWLYLMGGRRVDEENKVVTTEKVWRSLISPTGGIGGWREIRGLPSAIREHTVVVANRRIFLFGKADAIYISEVGDDGKIHLERSSLNLPYPTSNGAGVVTGGCIFYIGGIAEDVATSTVLCCKIAADGGVESVTISTPLPEPIKDHTVVRWREFVYVIGGRNSSGISKRILYTRLKGGVQ